MITCSKCNVEKHRSEFSPRSNRPGKFQAECKVCRNSRRNKNRRSKLIILYYLPEHHYVGITNDINQRMREHRRKGKLTDNYEIMAKFERRIDAAYVEIMLQQRGYFGFHKGNENWEKHG